MGVGPGRQTRRVGVGVSDQHRRGVPAGVLAEDPLAVGGVRRSCVDDYDLYVGVVVELLEDGAGCGGDVEREVVGEVGGVEGRVGGVGVEESPFIR